MRQRDKAYHWWKRKPSSVRKPLVLTLGMLLVIIAPFTGVLPGPGGVPIFVLGVAILASEFDWAERFKKFTLHHLPQKLKLYWRITPRWLSFFDVIGGLFVVLGLILVFYKVKLPIFEIISKPPFIGVVADRQQSWLIPVAVLAIAGLSIICTNRQRLKLTIQRLRQK